VVTARETGRACGDGGDRGDRGEVVGVGHPDSRGESWDWDHTNPPHPHHPLFDQSNLEFMKCNNLLTTGKTQPLANLLNLSNLISGGGVCSCGPHGKRGAALEPLPVLEGWGESPPREGRPRMARGKLFRPHRHFPTFGQAKLCLTH